MKDISLVRMTIQEIAKLYNVPIMEAMDIFYRSKLCKMLNDKETGLFTFTPYRLAKMIK